MPDQDTSVFKTPDATVTPVVTQPDKPLVTFPIPDQVKEYVGEGKQYNTVDAALESIPHALAHIAKIESENAELRNSAVKATTTQEILATINANQQPVQDPLPAQVDSSAIAAQAVQLMNEQSKAQTTHDNIMKADAATKEKYGDNAGQVTRDTALKLSISLDVMQELAGKSPAAFAKLLADNITTSPDVPIMPTQSSINTDALVTQHPVDNLKRPEKGVLHDSSTAEVLAEWRRCKALAAKDMVS